jgi:hypothetical protein
MTHATFHAVSEETTLNARFNPGAAPRGVTLTGFVPQSETAPPTLRRSSLPSLHGEGYGWSASVLNQA